MTQSLEEQKRLVDGLAGQARQVSQQYRPLVQAHQEQSSLAATLLEALTDLHQQIVPAVPPKMKKTIGVSLGLSWSLFSILALFFYR